MNNFNFKGRLLGVHQSDQLPIKQVIFPQLKKGELKYF